jgi:peptidoglycan/xylan/chitin deacetylase (PgdA/CDA1 family)
LVLDQLKEHNAKATFFCIGKNVVTELETYNRILEEKHQIGNHTHNHLKGSKSNKKTYIENILLAEKSLNNKAK